MAKTTLMEKAIAWCNARDERPTAREVRRALKCAETIAATALVRSKHGYLRTDLIDVVGHINSLEFRPTVRELKELFNIGNNKASQAIALSRHCNSSTTTRTKFNSIVRYANSLKTRPKINDVAEKFEVSETYAGKALIASKHGRIIKKQKQKQVKPEKQIDCELLAGYLSRKMISSSW